MERSTCVGSPLLFGPDNLASMTCGDIECCLAKERAPVRVEIRSKYPEKHSVTLVRNEDFFCVGVALASLRLLQMSHRVEVSERSDTRDTSIQNTC